MASLHLQFFFCPVNHTQSHTFRNSSFSAIIPLSNIIMIHCLHSCGLQYFFKRVRKHNWNTTLWRQSKYVWIRVTNPVLLVPWVLTASSATMSQESQAFLCPTKTQSRVFGQILYWQMTQMTTLPFSREQLSLGWFLYSSSFCFSI